MISASMNKTNKNISGFNYLLFTSKGCIWYERLHKGCNKKYRLRREPGGTLYPTDALRLTAASTLPPGQNLRDLKAEATQHY
jgi:hypothetical protein